MKIRNGFVSNSSSSSFIIGIAKVADEKRLKQILKKAPKQNRYEYVLGSFEEIKNSDLMGRVCCHNTILNTKSRKTKTEDKIKRIIVEAPVNSYQAVSIDTSVWGKDTVQKYIYTEDGTYVSEKPAKWFAICVGNNEGDGGDSPFYKYTKWQQFLSYCIMPINWMSRNLLDPIIKVLNKIFKKNWFYPYLYITAKSGYNKVKDHTFFKEEWQREIVKAFEDAEQVHRFPNEGVFSDEYGSHTYKIGADRNG